MILKFVEKILHTHMVMSLGLVLYSAFQYIPVYFTLTLQYAWLVCDIDAYWYVRVWRCTINDIMLALYTTCNIHLARWISHTIDYIRYIYHICGYVFCIRMPTTLTRYTYGLTIFPDLLQLRHNAESDIYNTSKIELWVYSK